MEGPTLGQPWAQYGLTATGKQKRKRVRSVMGCLTCRKRRVKCDEKRPKCSNCARHPLRVCEYEYDSNEFNLGPIEEQDQLDAASTMSFDTTFHDSSSFASSSKLTLDEFLPSSTSLYLPSPDYEKMLNDRRVIEGMTAELQSLRAMDSMLLSDPPVIPDIMQQKTPVPKQHRFTSFRAFHSALVRRCFSSSEDPRNRLSLSVASATLPPNLSNGISLGPQSLPTDISHLHRPDIFKEYVKSVRDKSNTLMVGKLGSIAFTLLMCEIMDPSPKSWREQFKSLIGKCIERGGPGWMIGLTAPIQGYKGGQIENKQPLSMALYLEMSAMIEIYACLTSGSIPQLTNQDASSKTPWILLSKVYQAKVSFSLPDTIETIFGIPRILIPTFSQVTTLVAKRNMQIVDDTSLKEHLDFEVNTMRMELEHLWPARLANRRDERRLQYGGRLWRLAILILLLQEAQYYSTSSIELITYVNSFFDLCQEALNDIGHLSGWLWPILLSSCASCNHSQREGFLRLLPYAKAPIGNTDNSEHAHKLLTMVWFYQDTGNCRFHLREALRIDNTLDFLIL
ncbi:uncharacterized protein I206_107867 [Kwoniella pini CBS 10737]|uniref:Zn(2)-C6 fungal-type domain-containing protein n=1 Tax=Kwoniella pini CBS 10737 TaxID=1296096 RepID=A0A1B9HYI9_9TREE|nr:uncharacterized protein I206_06198 [Kwoniella pini CBS 10737]OCF48330.1 hypothetical protein I206_06198 [Kwoniella pini CBS 10737]